jgi:hypothetical protein
MLLVNSLKSTVTLGYYPFGAFVLTQAAKIVFTSRIKASYRSSWYSEQISFLGTTNIVTLQIYN